MSVVLTLRYHDSEPGGGICKDDDDAKAEAAKVAREVLNDLADPDELHMALDKVACDRESATGKPSAIPRNVDEITDDEALEIAADLMQFEWDTLPGDPGPDPLPALETGVGHAFNVLANWERGDLAAAVNALREWGEATLELFPAFEVERPIKAEDLKPGDRVDLEDILTDDPSAEFEYGRVIAVERETPDCVRVDFENGFDSYGFDPARVLRVIRTPADLKAYADLAEA